VPAEGLATRFQMAKNSPFIGSLARRWTSGDRLDSDKG